jgi:hypothetical protein
MQSGRGQAEPSSPDGAQRNPGTACEVGSPNPESRITLRFIRVTFAKSQRPICRGFPGCDC